MTGLSGQWREIGRLAARQHGVVARRQLNELGLTRHAITHALASGRLHRVRRGVYAVGHRPLSREAEWLAAVLVVGRTSVLSHQSAGALWQFWEDVPEIHVSTPLQGSRHVSGLVVHRRLVERRDRDRQAGIPVTGPVPTLIDLAVDAPTARLEAAVNAADRLKLVRTDVLRERLDERPRRRGVDTLRRLLDRRTFRLTDSELERRFLRLVGEAGLPLPQTGVRLHGFKVDFFWPELGLVIETDGITYHRTPEQQERDHRRDQTHSAAGLTCLRFSHNEIRHEPEHVVAVVSMTIVRLSREARRAA
jgi:very-short-patch-repair endonuclease